MSRRGECPLSSRMSIFTSCSAAGDNIERGFSVAGGWSPRFYGCSFCGREFKSAQALGGHMNIHRRDRARLRISPSFPSLPHHADLSPAPQNKPKSGHSNLNLPFAEAACRDDPTSISTCLNTYLPPTIISATPTFKPLLMRSVADPPDLLAMAAPPSHDENSAASNFSVPISDLVSFRIGSTISSPATSFSKVQNGALSLFPNIAAHGSSLLIKSMLGNSSFKAVEALNVCAGAGQSRLDCSGAKAAAGRYHSPQRIEFSQAAKRRHKRTRGNDLDAVKICNEDKYSVAAPARSICVRPTHDVRLHNDIKELNCANLDLELRLGQSSPAPAGNQFLQTRLIPP